MDFNDWRIAYAKQAGSDLEAREILLERRELPSCHHLHYLQMACERACKAHLCRRGSSPRDLRQSHAHVAKQLPVIAKRYLAVRGWGGQDWVLDAIRTLARQIELLAPAVEDGGRVRSNCEYPWPGPRGRVVVPAEYNFGIDLLFARAGRTLVKVLRVAVDELARD